MKRKHDARPLLSLSVMAGDDGVPFQAYDFGVCPDCGAAISVTLTEDGDAPTAVLHTTPLCENYQRMDGSAYFAFVCDVRAAGRMDSQGDG